MAGNFVVGQSSASDASLNSATEWTIIRRATLTIPQSDTARHGCVVTASADVTNPGPPVGENQYFFVIDRNTTNPPKNTGSERTLALVDYADVDDPDSQPVSTTQHFNGLTRSNGEDGTGRHTFYFLGIKGLAGNTNTTVLDASLSVICVHTN
jgi:hypothetical protein